MATTQRICTKCQININRRREDKTLCVQCESEDRRVKKIGHDLVSRLIWEFFGRR